MPIVAEEHGHQDHRRVLPMATLFRSQLRATIARAERRYLVAGGCFVLAFALAACSGPDSQDDLDPTATIPPTVTVPATFTPTPSPTATETPEPTATGTATATSAASPTAEATPSGTGTAVATGTVSATTAVTPDPDRTPTVAQVGMTEALPTLDEIGSGFTLANQGARTALELANAYEDSGAHLDRLNEWGFREHVFREFTHQRTGDDDPLPAFVLATVNEYGSPEQADLALAWLMTLNTSQGQTLADPPEVGDNGFASTVTTAAGQPSATIFIRLEERVYAYYAEEGDPLPFVSQLAERVFERLVIEGE